MCKLLLRIVPALVLSTFLTSNSLAQSSACCGLDFFTAAILQSGVYGGYGIQQYNATGFNDYIKVYNEKRVNSLTKQMDDFGFAQGFKIGANILQFQSDDLLYGLKFFYQVMLESNEATANLPSGVTAKREYELSLRTIGIGTSFSYIINNNFDYKILDLTLTFNSATLKNIYTEGTQSPVEQKLESPESSIGFIAATGLVFYPVPPYISLEVNAGYSLFSITEMEFDGGGLLARNEDSNEAMDNFIDGGGFFAFAHLMVSIPFN